MEEKRRKRRERYHKLHPNAKYYNQPKQTLKEKKVRTKQTLKEKKEKQRLYDLAAGKPTSLDVG